MPFNKNRDFPLVISRIGYRLGGGSERQINPFAGITQGCVLPAADASLALRYDRSDFARVRAFLAG